jgi:exosortase A-associated hydrolase 2
MDAAPEAFFMPAGGGARGQRLCVYHRPHGAAARGAIVYIHPFAEEMNKSRRMAALQSRAFARAGYAVLQIDLLGCGDSSGDFGEATWDDWVADVLEAAGWLLERHAGPLMLWGVRCGGLIASDAAHRIDTPCDLLLWQPPASGKTLLTQFLRLRIAAEMLDGQANGTVEKLRSQLVAGQAVEIAGYRLAPALAGSLDRAILVPPPPPSRVTWLEISTRAEATLLPASAATVERWRQTGVGVDAQVVPGPAFWSATEMEEAPLLIDATTLAALAGMVAA